MMYIAYMVFDSEYHTAVKRLTSDGTRMREAIFPSRQKAEAFRVKNKKKFNGRTTVKKIFVSERRLYELHGRRNEYLPAKGI